MSEEKALKPAESFKIALSDDNKYGAQIKAAIGNNPALLENFIQTAAYAYARDPELGKNKQSLIDACIKCAKDGLLPDGREAVFTNFGGKTAYMPMIDGVKKKLYQTGIVESIFTGIVHEGDAFEQWTDSNGPDFKHVPARKERGPAEGCFALIKLKSGGRFFEYMEKADIEKRKAEAKSKNVWNKWSDEMWKKTVIKQVAKLMPREAMGSFADTLDNDSYQEEMPSGSIQERSDMAADIAGHGEVIDENNIPEGVF